MNPRDAIRINGMRFWGKHGANPHEQDKAQRIDIDLELHLDSSRASASDDLADALDYRRPYEICQRFVTTRSFNLLEALARACLVEILSDERILAGTIRVSKPHILSGATPEVQISLSRRS